MFFGDFRVSYFFAESFVAVDEVVTCEDVFDVFIDFGVDGTVLFALVLVDTVAEVYFTVVGVFGGDIDTVGVFVGSGIFNFFLLRAAFGTDVGVVFDDKVFFVGAVVAYHAEFLVFRFGVDFVVFLGDISVFIDDGVFIAVFLFLWAGK